MDTNEMTELKIGDMVTHIDWIGYGEVVEIDAYSISVEWDDGRHTNHHVMEGAKLSKA
jgi:hypothetical protein